MKVTSFLQARELCGPHTVLGIGTDEFATHGRETDTHYVVIPEDDEFDGLHPCLVEKSSGEVTVISSRNFPVLFAVEADPSYRDVS